MTRFATTLGLFPLPDWAKSRLTELKGRQRDDLISGNEGSAITGVYDEARTEVIEWQADAGLDRIVEGQLRWDDMLCHPLVVHDHVDTGGLVRYYDNNNFYRETIVRDSLSPDGDVAAELRSAGAHSAGPLQAIFPGPHSLAHLATDAYYEDETTFLAAVGEFLAGEIAALESVETLMLLEPSLVTDPPDDLDPVVEALDAIAAAARTAAIDDVIVQTYWGAPHESVYAAILGIDSLGIGLDLVTAGEDALDLVTSNGVSSTVSLGVVDGQNTRIESPAEVTETVERFEQAADGLDRVYLTPNTELFYLPTNRAVEKLTSLATVVSGGEA